MVGSVHSSVSKLTRPAQCLHIRGCSWFETKNGPIGHSFLITQRLHVVQVPTAGASRACFFLSTIIGIRFGIV